MSYYDIYRKRLSKDNRVERAIERHNKLNTERATNFESFLYSSPHYVKFMYVDPITQESREVEAVLEPHQENETKEFMQLLCRVGEEFEVGAVAEIDNEYYMLYYWNNRKNSGYNKWTIVHMNKEVTWSDEAGEHSTLAYMYYQQDNMLKNELRSRSRSSTLYSENLKLNFLLMPFHDHMIEQTYMEITTQGRTQGFRVTGIDIVSTPGVMYVSMDPTYLRGDTSKPIQTENDDPDDFFWLNGGEDGV